MPSESHSSTRAAGSCTHLTDSGSVAGKVSGPAVHITASGLSVIPQGTPPPLVTARSTASTRSGPTAMRGARSGVMTSTLSVRPASVTLSDLSGRFLDEGVHAVLVVHFAPRHRRIEHAQHPHARLGKNPMALVAVEQ